MSLPWTRVTWYTKLIALIIFIVLPFLAFYLGLEYGKVLGEIKVMDQTTNRSTITNDRQKAIAIAQEELFKKYPQGKRASGDYVVTDVSQVKGKPNQWTVVFDIPLTTDVTVWITVDISNGQVIDYREAEA